MISKAFLPLVLSITLVLCSHEDFEPEITWPPLSRFCCENPPQHCVSITTILYQYTTTLFKRPETDCDPIAWCNDRKTAPVFNVGRPYCAIPQKPTTPISCSNTNQAPAGALTSTTLNKEDCRGYNSDVPMYGKSNFGKEPIRSMDLDHHTSCKYTLDFSLSKDPLKIQKTYFNERGYEEIRTELESPKTISYFEVVKTDQGEGYYGFPYFLIIRSICEHGDYYGLEFYHQAIIGNSPSVQLTYFPKTTRTRYENALRLSLKSILVNLKQDPEKILVPDPIAPRVKSPDGSEACHLKICYIAYAVPFPFLQVPIVEVNIPESRTIPKFKKYIYVSSFHTRTVEGSGQLIIAKKFTTEDEHKAQVTSISPRFFFPKERFDKYNLDPDLYHSFETPDPNDPSSTITASPEDICLVPEGNNLAYQFDIPPSFYFRGKENMLQWALEEMEQYRKQFPLNNDDFYQAQYSLGTSPIAVLAGFHRPDLVMVGDPNWSHIELVQWDFNNKDTANIFDPNPTCVFKVKNGNGPSEWKPLYASQRYDTQHTTFGHRTYHQLDYKSEDTQAVFQVLSFEDRILIKTLGGLVTLYGITNDTIGLEKALRAPEDEQVKRCFKILRMPNVALMKMDPIVAVTFKYEHEGDDVDEEIWYGRVKHAGDPITWKQLGINEFADEEKNKPPRHVIPATSNVVRLTETSEAGKICSQVYIKHVLKIPLFDVTQTGANNQKVSFDWRNHPDVDRCNILDATPVPSYPDKVQLLVEMSFTYFQDKKCYYYNAEGSYEPCPEFKPHKCMRFLYCLKHYPPSSPTSPTSKPTPNLPPFAKNPSCKQDFGAKLMGLYDAHPKDGSQIYDLIQKQKASPPTPNTNDPKQDVDDKDVCYGSNSVEYEELDPYDESQKKKYKIWEGQFTDYAKPDVYKQYCNFDVQHIVLYVVAEHEVGKVLNEGTSWQIIGIYPRRPCITPFFESVRTVMPFDETYFEVDNVEIAAEQKKTCFERYFSQMANDIIISRFTYTNQVNNHLFLYGNRLLHSSDGGRTLVYPRDFPLFPLGFDMTDYDAIQILNRNTIKLMAFAASGQYAFLTAKRELWVGNTGSNRQIRVRPSDGWSMQNLRLYKYQKGVQFAIPFSIFYDAFNSLFELVAVKDSEGHISEIIRRPVNVHLIFRNEDMVEKLKHKVNEKIEKDYDLRGSNPAECPKITTPSVQPEPIPLIDRNNEGQHQCRFLTPNAHQSELAMFCPFSQMKISQNYSKTLNRLQLYHLGGPIQHVKLGRDCKKSCLQAYSAGVFQLVYSAFLKKNTDEFYSHFNRDPFTRWTERKIDAANFGRIQFLRGDPEKHGIYIDPRFSIRNIDPTDKTGKKFIYYYWLDYKQIVSLEFKFFLKNAQILSPTDFEKQKLSEVQINVDNGNNEIIHLDTHREVDGKYAAVIFNITIRLNQSKELVQSLPGQGLVPVPLTFHLIGAFGRCFNLEHWGMIGESISTTVNAGCQPATDLLFDWNSTLHSLQFRIPDKKYGDSSYCYGGHLVCFYAKEDIVFHFDILDLSKQAYVPFTGLYKLSIVGAGKTEDSIEYFSQDEINAYNIPGKSDISLIWTLSPINSTSQELEKDPHSGENILRAGETKIRWVCNTLSPCARIAPKITTQVVFFFKMRVTNDQVDDETLCLHEREFVIMMYGFPPSPELLLLASLVFCLLLLGILYILFICCRQHRKLWRANRAKMRSWFRLVLDTFPKRLKRKPDTDIDQARKDSLLLSLQGHLNVPNIEGRSKQRQRSRASSSASTIPGTSRSGTTLKSESTLPYAGQRKAKANWTDMVYEQIISRRLIGIVERNKKLKENILSKVEPPVTIDEVNIEGQKEMGKSEAYTDDEMKQKIAKKSA